MTSAQERGKWTKQRWLYAVGGVLGIQLALVALLVRAVRPSQERPTFATRVQLIGQDEATRLPASVDPALFALPSLNGFSGSAWLRYRSLEHTQDNRTETPAWLNLKPAALGADFVRFLSTNTIAPPLLVDEPLPSVLRYNNLAISEPVAPVSRLRIEGSLAGRALAGEPDLPSWPNSDIVTNTVVRAAIDGSGRCFSAALLSRSGLAAADEYALRFVETARFKPVPTGAGRPVRQVNSDDLVWGTLTFLWHTLPMPFTNTPPVVP